MAKTYTREFKIEAVRLSYQTEKPLDELAADLGISRSSLNRWRREYGEDPDQAFPGKGQQRERDAEVAQLKKALRETQLEIEVLKKQSPSSCTQSDEISVHRRPPHQVPDYANVPNTGCLAERLLCVARATAKRAGDG